MNDSIPPGHAVVVYDGDCVFCSRSMAWIARHDRRDRVRFASAASPTGTALMRRHGLDPLDPSSFLVLIDGIPHIRSEAMLRLVAILDRRVRPLGVLRLVPPLLRDVVYDATARNRRRLSLVRTCPVPSSAMRDRMLP